VFFYLLVFDKRNVLVATLNLADTQTGL
jgi:hypothetical protein